MHEQNTQVIDKTNKKNGAGLKLVGLIVLFLVTIGATTYAVYAWQQNRSLTNDVATKQEKIDSLQKENKSTVVTKQTGDETAASMITEDLGTSANSKKITYKLSSDNSQIILFNKKGDGSGFVAITDKRVFEFITTVDNELLKKVCVNGSDDSTGISMGFIDASSKSFRNNQYANCLILLSDDWFNSDKDTREKAKALLDIVTKNINRFIAESIIK